VKVEHVVRGTWLLDNGTRGMDYSIAGIDVDCKQSSNPGRFNGTGKRSGGPQGPRKTKRTGP